MKFLDLNGLNHFWTKIKASFGTALIITSKCEIYNDPNVTGIGIIIPFVTNHQFINSDTETTNNVYNWFQKASRGGILETTFAGDFLTGLIFCKSNNGISFLYQVKMIQSKPVFSNINFLSTNFANYIRLIKKDDNTLVIAEFIQNKQN